MKPKPQPLKVLPPGTPYPELKPGAFDWLTQPAKAAEKPKALPEVKSQAEHLIDIAANKWDDLMAIANNANHQKQLTLEAEVLERRLAQVKGSLQEHKTKMDNYRKSGNIEDLIGPRNPHSLSQINTATTCPTVTQQWVHAN